MSLTRMYKLCILSINAGAALAFALLACGPQQGHATPFNVFVASNGDNTVYRIPDSFGGAAVGAGQLFGNGYTADYALASLNGDVYVGQLNGLVYRKPSWAGGAGTGTLFATATASLYDMDFADSDNLQVVGSANTVQVFNSSGTSLGTYGISTAGSGGIDYAPGDGVYVTPNFNKVQRLTGTGTSYNDATSGGLGAITFSQYLQQIVKGPDGFLYIAKFGVAAPSSNPIFRVDPTTGAFTTLFPTGTVTVGVTPYNILPVGIDIGPDGKLYFTDYNNDFLFRSNLDGTSVEIVATGFNDPTGITFAPVPEPGSFALLIVGGIVALARRRRR